MWRRFALGAAVAALFSSAVAAATLEDVKTYDRNRNGKLDGDELLVFDAHQKDSVLKKYDTNKNGVLEPAELARAHADLDKRYGGHRKPDTVGNDPTSLFARGWAVGTSKSGGIRVEDLAEPPKIVPNECEPPQQLYVRRDRLDTFLYGITPRKQAKGASISYTDDHAADQRTAVIDGVVSYALWRDPCRKRPDGVTVDDPFVSAYAFAPWVSAHGSLTSPRRRNEKSDLRAGFDVQFDVFGGPLFDYQAFTIAPYVLSDFRGEGRGAGGSLFWDPYKLDFRLGGTSKRLSEYIDWYWQLRVEADARRVHKTGVTGLDERRYAWLGATARLHVFFLPAVEGIPDFLQNRLHGTFTVKSFWDAHSSASIYHYAAELAYDLTSDGSASVSVAYERGMLKEDLEAVNQYIVRLNYKY